MILIGKQGKHLPILRNQLFSELRVVIADRGFEALQVCICRDGRRVFCGHCSVDFKSQHALSSNLLMKTDKRCIELCQLSLAKGRAAFFSELPNAETVNNGSTNKAA